MLGACIRLATCAISAAESGGALLAAAVEALLRLPRGVTAARQPPLVLPAATTAAAMGSFAHASRCVALTRPRLLASDSRPDIERSATDARTSCDGAAQPALRSAVTTATWAERPFFSAAAIGVVPRSSAADGSAR